MNCSPETRRLPLTVLSIWWRPTSPCRPLDRAWRIPAFPRRSTKSSPAAWPSTPTTATERRAASAARRSAPCGTADTISATPCCHRVARQPRWTALDRLRRVSRQRMRTVRPLLYRPGARRTASPQRRLLIAIRVDPGCGFVLPTVIAVAAALILAGIGVVIGLLAHKPTGQQQPPPARAALPPLVTGPDHSSLHQACDEGFSLPTATGFGTHAGRGTPETSCLFANSVLTSYWAEYGNASPLPRAVSAPGAVDCKAVPGALCNGSNFLTNCQQSPGDSSITCIKKISVRRYLG